MMNPWTWYRRRHAGIQLGLAAAGIAGLVLAYWLVSPLFIVVRGSEETPPSVSTEGSGTFVGDGWHHAGGTALLLRQADGSYVVRLDDDFRVTNGPDIHVWLSPTPDRVDGGIDLGPVKFTEGSSNYAVPSAQAAGYQYVIIWCNPFSVIFGHAELTPA